MRKILESLRILFFALIIALVHIGLFNVLPHPFHMINITFASLVLFILFKSSGKIVWLSFLLHFFMDVYSVTPFGTYLISGTVSILLLYWLYKELFTNHSFLSVIAMTVIGLGVFRIIYLSIISIVTHAPMRGLPILFMWEIIFTTLLTCAIYAIVTSFFKKYASSFV